MERTQFTFYESFYKAISRIKKKPDRAVAYDAICAYALYGTEPDLNTLPDAAAIAFELVRPNLDASRRRAVSGKQGGSKPKANSKQSESKGEANAKQEESESKKENEKENKREIENECYPPKPPAGARPRFVPPSLDAVRAYCLERQNGVDPQRFLDFYTANGWKQGKGKPIVDWKAAVRTWERKEEDHGRDHSHSGEAESKFHVGTDL